jgi:methylthioribose-1-phosphate isomerase
MAEQLAAAGVSVTHYTDAALGHALSGADGLLVGADAISPDWFLNKSGTRMLVASAVQQGVPVYVLATRDKFLSTAIASHLEVRDEGADQVWPSPPPGVSVRNPCFETTPIDLVSAVISDAGVLGAGLVADACSTAGDDVLLDLLQGPT